MENYRLMLALQLVGAKYYGVNDKNLDICRKFHTMDLASFKLYGAFQLKTSLKDIH